MPEPLFDAVRTFALALPEAWEDHPWGDTVAKVGKKIFVFLGDEAPADGGCWLGVKLPESKELVLAMSFAKSMGYGLDRGGWVGIQAPPDTPLEMLLTWVEESYRAVAPRTLVAELDARQEPEGT
jgi:predicted DNA-binding protein (MmcQ/YjbR family)